jgi:hypothetical protein
MGAKTRMWLFCGTFIQCLFTMASALAIWKCGQLSVSLSRGEPNWTNTLGFVGLGLASASIGLQGIMGKRVNSQFATTGESCFGPLTSFLFSPSKSGSNHDLVRAHGRPQILRPQTRTLPRSQGNVHLFTLLGWLCEQSVDRQGMYMFLRFSSVLIRRSRLAPLGH